MARGNVDHLKKKKTVKRNIEVRHKEDIVNNNSKVKQAGRIHIPIVTNNLPSIQHTSTYLRATAKSFIDSQSNAPLACHGQDGSAIESSRILLLLSIRCGS